MEVCCSFKSVVGGPCSFDRRDRTRAREIVPLLSCTKQIDQHKTSYGFQDIGNEVELILARSAMFSMPENIKTMTICPSHRSRIGLGWVRGTDRCRVPETISKHKNVRSKFPKAERGITKMFSQVILRKTGLLLPVGSGMYFCFTDIIVSSINRNVCLNRLLLLTGACRSCRGILQSLCEEQTLLKEPTATFYCEGIATPVQTTMLVRRRFILRNFNHWTY